MTDDTSGIVIKEVRSRRDLADYLTSLPGADVSYDAMLTHYISSEAHGRADVFLALNCAAEWKPALLAEFRSEQRRRHKRGNGRSVYHFVISRRGRTEPKILAAMAKRLLVLTGLDKQKALIAVHTDTDDNHVHIAVSALDDHGRQIILERGYSKVLLAHVNAQLCHEFGYEPESGLGFHATDEGVFRTDDGAKLRDAAFRKVTNDLRKQPALTPLSAAFERETGLPSIQRRIRDEFDEAMKAETLEGFSIELAASGIQYTLVGSGAMISCGTDRFKASTISRSASPKRLARHFGVLHLTEPEAQTSGLDTGAGFYRKDSAGVLRPVRIAAALRPESRPILPLEGASERNLRHRSDQRVEQDLPPATQSHMKALHDRIDLLSARPSPVRKWQIERLKRAIYRSTGNRGRPPRSQALSTTPNLPTVDLNDDTAIILGPANHGSWKGIPSWGDVRFKKVGPSWHITRGSRPVATFGPGLIVVHQATDADKEQILKFAKLDFANDVQVFCRPAERRSWIRAAQATDLVLGNIELGKAQSNLWRGSQAKLARLAGRLATTGEMLLSAKAELLGSASDTLKSLAPVLDRAHASGRARTQGLSKRLSVQHARIEADAIKEQTGDHSGEDRVSQPSRPQETLPLGDTPARNVSAPLGLPPEPAAPLVRPPLEPMAFEAAAPPRNRTPVERTFEIAEDGTLRWLWPESELAIDRGTPEQKSARNIPAPSGLPPEPAAPPERWWTEPIPSEPAAPLARSPLEPMASEVAARPRDRTPVEQTFEIAEDGTLRWLWPESERDIDSSPLEPRQAQSSPPDRPGEAPPSRSLPTEPSEATNYPAPARLVEQPPENARGVASPAPSPAGERVPDEVLQRPIPRESEFEEAVRLADQLDAVPCIRDGHFTIRLIDTADWKRIAVPPDRGEIAAAACSAFIHRINAVEAALVGREISLGADDRPTARTSANAAVLADTRRLAHHEESLQLIRDTAQRAVPSEREEPSQRVAERSVAPLQSHPSATALALQRALTASGEKSGRKAKQVTLAGKVVETFPSEPAGGISPPAEPRKPDITLLVARRGARSRNWDPRDYGEIKSVDALDRHAGADKNNQLLDPRLVYGVQQNGQSI